MSPIDLAIVAVFFLAMMAIGFRLKDGQGTVDTYFVGDRQMGAGHIGFSVVATDGGGGFSIGLGGLGTSALLMAVGTLLSSSRTETPADRPEAEAS